MKKYIRACIAFAACVIMLFNASVSAVSFKDVNSQTEYEDAITTLTTLGVISGYEDGTFRPDNNITRAEFTVLVVRALAMENEQTTEQTIPFEDLLGHYARLNVKTAYDMGIISGFDDGMFRPDDNVTYEQAMKMVVCMLGYGGNAVSYGGYPMGYLKVGVQLGLADKISVPNSEPASRAVIAKLLNNALNIKMLRPVLNADGSSTYIQTDETILKDRLKIERAKVMITGVGDAEVSGGNRTLKSYEMRAVDTKTDSEIIMDVSGLYKDYDEVKQYLGHVIYVYYKNVDEDESDTDILIAIDSQPEENSEVTIESRAIIEYRNNTLKYSDVDGKEKAIKIEPENMSIVYNNKIAEKTEHIAVGDERITVERAIDKWLEPESGNFLNGEVKIVDSDNDGSADVIFIMNYSVMVATASPSSTDYTINDKLVAGSRLTLDPDDDSYEYTITRNGSAVTSVTSLKANDVILYAKSIDGEYITLNVTGKPVTGTISNIEDDIVTIGDKRYEVTEKCTDYLEGNAQISLGAQGTFYIDCYNNIIFATINKNDASVQYAYLINATESTETENIYATLYSPSVSSSSTTRYNLAEKVSFNGRNMSSANAKDALEETAEYSRADIENKDKVYANSTTKPNAGKCAQLIKYSVKKDEIQDIITLSKPAIDETTGKGAYNEESDELHLYAPLAKYTYSATNNFSNVFQMNSSTTIIYVPGDRSERNEYHKYTASSIFKVNQSYWVEAYDVNTSKIASLVIVYGNSSLADITKDTVMSVVAKTPTTVDVSDESVNKLSLYNSSASLTTKNADDDTEFADVKPGDVIQFGQSNSNRAINRRNIISADDVRAVFESGNEYNWSGGKFNVPFINDEGNVEVDAESGTVYSRAFVANVVEVIREDDGSYIRVTQDGFDADGNLASDHDERYEITSKTPIIRFDMEKDTVSAYADGTTAKLTVDSLRDAKYSGAKCSKVFIYTLKGNVKFIMMYE